MKELHDRVARGGPEGRRRPGRGARGHARGARARRARAARGRAGRGQDAAGERDRRARWTRRVPAPAVHARHAALRRHRHDGAARRRARLPARAGVRRRRAGRRDQPHAAQDAGRAAGGDAGGPGDRRRRARTRCRTRSSSLATQNPVEYEGTYPLPEAQRDRFLVHVAIGYPSADEERAMLRLARRGLAPTALDDVRPVASAEDLRAARAEVDATEVDRRGRRLRRRDRPPHARAARASRSAPARARRSTCSPPPRPPRGWPAAPTSRPTTSPGWPRRCCATGSSSRPRPSWSASPPPTRSAALEDVPVPR